MLRKKGLELGIYLSYRRLAWYHGILSFTPIPKVGPALGRWRQEDHKFQIISYAT